MRVKFHYFSIENRIFKALGAGCSRKIYAKIGVIVGAASLLLSFLMPMFLILRAG